MEAKQQYAAFIITYKRVEVLKDTILQLSQQSLPPAKILIVDNDPEKSAKDIVQFFPLLNLTYHSVGYNAGPAGAGFWGTKLLFTEGWEWVLWMDDNDPPHFPDVIEHLFEIPKQYPHPQNIGMLGAVGVKFNSKKAKVNRIPDAELKGIIEVDNVAGNMMPIINKRVFDQQIFPDPQLFFGFEELDYSLAIIRSGFKVLVSGEELFRHRQKAGRLNLKQTIYKQKNSSSLWREFYSMRNLVYILKTKEHAYQGVATLFIRSFAKSILGFKYGFKYGINNMRFLIQGFWAGYFGKLGFKEMKK